MLSTLARIVATVWLVTLAAGSTPTIVIPNFSDLTIRTRATVGVHNTAVTTWYFKGARQRVEQQLDSPSHTASVYLMQCDQKASYSLYEQSKTYLLTGDTDVTFAGSTN
jgi:hypothetical protein